MLPTPPLRLSFIGLSSLPLAFQPTLPTQRFSFRWYIKCLAPFRHRPSPFRGPERGDQELRSLFLTVSNTHIGLLLSSFNYIISIPTINVKSFMLIKNPLILGLFCLVEPQQDQAPLWVQVSSPLLRF